MENIPNSVYLTLAAIKMIKHESYARKNNFRLLK